VSGHLEWRRAQDAIVEFLSPKELDSVSENGNPDEEWALRIAGIDGNGLVVTGTMRELVDFVDSLVGMIKLASEADRLGLG
jgi:hypothetical protein